MPMKKIILDGKTLKSLDDIYDRLSEALSLPNYFGRNLDALWDLMSTDVEGPFEIIWENAGESKKTMGRDFKRIVKLFEDLKKERDDFKFKIEK